MFYFYLVASAALIPLLDNFFDILRQPYSWWLVPLLFIGFFLAFVILQLALLAVPSVFVNTKKSADKAAGYFRFMTDISIPLLMKILRIKLNVKGTEKLPENTRMFFVCNHQSDLDPIMLLSAFPEAGLGFIGKKEIYKTMPVIGKLMHKLYCLPIDRENDREAVKTIIAAVKLLKDDKASVGLFPEGYTSKTCELLPFRNGAFKVAYKAKVPIVVCVVNNTRSIAKRMILHRTDIELRVLNVIYPAEFERMNTTELGDILHDEMLTALNELRNLQNK